MSITELDTLSYVYLEGDSAPLECSLSPEAVASRIHETCSAAAGDVAAWVRIPLKDEREALVRPSVVVAIVPAPAEN